ncbi:hypothetical protein PUN28_010695 [Cardiocondyla obscurior]|uniref:Uncharacterized protein n=1 Tax=Cardiocondyla obscurior TaxID=286306 RepID=A0AAW2FMY9_9HYME
MHPRAGRRFLPATSRSNKSARRGRSVVIDRENGDRKTRRICKLLCRIPTVLAGTRCRLWEDSLLFLAARNVSGELRFFNAFPSQETRLSLPPVQKYVTDSYGGRIIIHARPREYYGRNYAKLPRYRIRLPLSFVRAKYRPA